jgi:hypothetical protein
MKKTNIILLYVAIFLFISCSKTPTGMYEGEIGEESIILDFTVDNVVIVKSANIYEISRVNNVDKSIFYEKSKCYWTKNNKLVSIYNKDKIRVFYFKIVGQDFIDMKSGERLVKKITK